MKKVLLTAAAVSVLATSSAYAMEDMFYVKANVGWSKLNKVDGFKSKNDVHFGLGAGYHVMDNARVDFHVAQEMGTSMGRGYDLQQVL